MAELSLALMRGVSHNSIPKNGSSMLDVGACSVRILALTSGCLLLTPLAGMSGSTPVGQIHQADLAGGRYNRRCPFGRRFQPLQASFAL